MRRKCPKRKKNQDGFLNSDLANFSDGLDNAEVLIVSTVQSNNEWIMNSRSTYHVTPRKEFFFNFRQLDGGKVLMGNDQTCNVNGIGSVNSSCGMVLLELLKM